MNRTRTCVYVALCVGVVPWGAVQGCTTDKPLSKQAVASLSPLKAVRYETPTIRKFTGATLGVGGLLLGGIGMDVVGAAAGKALTEDYRLPDYGQLVLRQLYERLSTEIPDWPPMTIEEAPVGRENAAPGGPLLSVEVDQIWIYSFGALKGFNALTIGEVRAPTGEVLWSRRFFYQARPFGRDREMEDLEAEDAKLLKEEMMFAATKTADDFIAHLKGGGQP